MSLENSNEASCRTTKVFSRSENISLFLDSQIVRITTVKGEGRKEVVGDKDEGNGISREEVKEAIARIKRNKATGEDGMAIKAVMYGGEGVRKEIWKICNIVWREGWPKGSRTGLVFPLIKKGRVLRWKSTED